MCRVIAYNPPPGCLMLVPNLFQEKISGMTKIANLKHTLNQLAKDDPYFFRVVRELLPLLRPVLLLLPLLLLPLERLDPDERLTELERPDELLRETEPERLLELERLETLRPELDEDELRVGLRLRVTFAPPELDLPDDLLTLDVLRFDGLLLLRTRVVAFPESVRFVVPPAMLPLPDASPVLRVTRVTAVPSSPARLPLPVARVTREPPVAALAVPDGLYPA